MRIRLCLKTKKNRKTAEKFYKAALEGSLLRIDVFVGLPSYEEVTIYLVEEKAICKEQ